MENNYIFKIFHKTNGPHMAAHQSLKGPRLYLHFLFI